MMSLRSKLFTWLKQPNWFLIINILIVVGLLVWPYLVFGKKLYIGGDDSRLYYSYPELWMKEFVHSTWFNFSNVGSNNPQFSVYPLVIILSGLKMLGLTDYMLQNISFSFILILGFIFFQRFFIQITHTKNRAVPLIMALGYITSPILFTNEYSVFQQFIWLIPLFPILAFFSIRFVEEGQFKDVVYGALFSIVFACGINGIPWFLGLMFPLVLSGILFLVLSRPKVKFEQVKRIGIFWAINFLAQSFWLVPFLTQYFSGSSLVSDVLGAGGTFAPTVEGVVHGNNIFYPLIQLFHHHIQSNFGWATWYTYLHYYDKFLYIDLIYIIVLFLGVWYSRRKPSPYFSFVFLMTLVVLFLFTVNLGFFKQIFLAMGHIPGFVMFRNFFSKFPLAYVVSFSALIGMCLLVIERSVKRTWYLVIVTIVGVVVVINSVPLLQGQIFTSKQWTSRETYRNITVPKEYLSFMDDLKSRHITDSILTMPYNVASYAYLQDETTGNTYIGRSPVQLFSGINDYSGDLSFAPRAQDIIFWALKDKNITNLNKVFYLYDINYAMSTNNISEDMRYSYPYGTFYPKKITSYDKDVFAPLFAEKVTQSDKGTYELFALKDQNALIRPYTRTQVLGQYQDLIHDDMSVIKQTAYVYDTAYAMPDNPNNAVTVTYDKQQKHLYSISIQNLSTPTVIGFNDSYDKGWKLRAGGKDVEAKHFLMNLSQNGWLLDPASIKKNLSTKYYTTNGDGSINLNLNLYFMPQSYFESGTAISMTTITLSIVYLAWLNRKKIGEPRKKKS